MQDYFIHNLETDKLELHFSKSAYKALSREQQGKIKSYFLFSKNAEAWVSKGKVGVGGAGMARVVANGLDLLDAGTEGESLNFTEQQQKRVERAEHLDSLDLNGRAASRLRKAEQEFMERDKSIDARYPSPWVVGPSGYPASKLRKRSELYDSNMRAFREKQKHYEQRAGVNHAQLLKQLKDPVYLNNRLEEALAEFRSAERDNSDRRMDEAEAKIDYYQEQIAAIGGNAYSKERLTELGATHVQYRGRWYPIVRLNAKTVTFGRWLSGSDRSTWQPAYADIQNYKIDPSTALLNKPGEKAPKVEKVFRKGDEAYYITNYRATGGKDDYVRLVRVTAVGQKYYSIRGYASPDKVPFSELKPLGYGHEKRLEAMLAGAEPLREEIIDRLQHPDDKSKYDFRHFLEYGQHPYRNESKILHHDLVAAGYPPTGGLLAFFRDKYGLDKPKSRKPANKAKNASYRTAATRKKAINAVSATKGKSGATTLKGRIDAAKQRIAERRGVEPETIKVYLDEDTNRVTEKRLKVTVSAEKTKRAAIKAGTVSTDKPKLTKAERADIKRKAIDDAEQATGKKKELTAEQVIKLGKRINFNRYHIVIDGQVYNIREDFDTPITNKRRLAPTEDNLLKWARKPGRYDLIGVDSAGKIDVTVHRKRDKNKVPIGMRVRKIGQDMKQLRARKPKPRRKK